MVTWSNEPFMSVTGEPHVSLKYKRQIKYQYYLKLKL